KAIDMGAIVDPVQRDRIQTLVAQGAKEGGEVWSPNIAMPESGCFFPPTLISNVSPSNIVAREEIFGPVLVSMTFRTLKEAVALANNTRYGLAATIWSENINRALEAASQMKAGVVWINTTNGFDAACGFGGYRESGFGREGGREGMYEYVKPRKEWGAAEKPAPAPKITEMSGDLEIDQTPKQFIGGKQKRPDWARTIPVATHDGKYAGRVALGNRKDIRDAVEAAFNAESWAVSTGHARAQILYFIAENFSKRASEFARRLTELTGASKAEAKTETDAAISRLFSYGAWADKFDGLAHSPPQRNVVLAVNEPIGIIGIVCPDASPLLSFVSLWAPVVAMGNRCVIVPSERYALIATDFYQVLETSDVPAGVINIITGERATLTKTLAEHAQVDAIWHHGPPDESKLVEALSADNLKRTWTSGGKSRDWMSAKTGEGREFLRRACEVKNIWLPYGD
ncbi:MAG: aldehyde dehydrogenase family protein, partial [Parvularculaceae bacterium]